MVTRTIFPSDEELGKRDDDHKPGRTPPWWNVWRTPLRYRKRRIVLALLACYFIYVFIHNIPTDLGPVHGRGLGGSQQTVPIGRTSPSHTEPTGPPPGIAKSKEDGPPQHTYNGQIRFFKLAVSLHGAATSLGYRQMDRNVLFAISNLKSASVLIPMICEMARWNRNYVHAVFMGRDAIPMDDILEINGVDKGNCGAYWHDARPDYSEYSTDFRAEGSVAAAMNHIHTFLRPHVIIMDDSIQEDAFFVRSIRAKAKEQGLTIVEVPKDGSENFMWITRLDSGSLKSWHKATVDILIQASPQSSGSLIRLLKSIGAADYTGLKPPRLIMELPSNQDPPLQHYLENLVWPPSAKDNPLMSNLLTIRHRIPNQRISPEEASIRFLESFYPASPSNSHVLLLSPQAQLSPLYYHYLKYNLLEYKYSSYSADDAKKVIGVSLEIPAHLLDGTSSFKAPALKKMNNVKYKATTDIASVPFLWEAPNSNAALYFGDKWVELHSFLSNRIAIEHQGPRKASRAKIVSETLPSWTEYFLEFMRARGYSLLYPGTTSAENFVTIHNELYRLPEEFSPVAPKQAGTEDEGAPPKLPDGPFLTAEPLPEPPNNFEPPLIPFRPLHAVLPFDGDLAEIPHLPYLLYTGEYIHPENVTTVANSFMARFQQDVGNCKPTPEGKKRKVKVGSADDLFCFSEVLDDDFEDDEEFLMRQLESETETAPESTNNIGGEANASLSMESTTMASTVAAKVPPTAPTLSGITAAEVVEPKQLHDGI
ncbi:hypothetical protein AOQ84DRAFT_354410 [Glonium stellatum]|uniref:Glycosyltransferase 2 n=1 Tax=Glonium stellatum TaxID=574774 RepID=A0A8E2JTJ3_9PEZI|nr:hypothetical protein AOQ84DRAFT_354410 [Glonium stellatum]